MLYHLKEGFRSIFTHSLMSVAAVCMILACLLIMGTFSLVAVNLNAMLGDFEAENVMFAYIDDALSEEEARAIQVEIDAVPNVFAATFVTREEAGDAFLESRENQAIFQDLPDEVFRHRFRIRVTDIREMSATVSRVEEVDGVARVRAELEIAQTFVVMRNVAGGVAFVLVAVLLLVSLFIISNTIRLTTFTRREEIAIMKMCGATDWFIRWPFIFEGLILGLIGAVAAFFLQWGVYTLIGQAVLQAGELSFFAVLPFLSLAPQMGAVFLGAGFLIGGLGSMLAIGKFLQV